MLTRIAMRISLLSFLAVPGMTVGVVQPLHAQPYETNAKQALLVDDASGTILLSKNQNDTIFPAALAKLMTMEVVFHALKEGKVTLDTEYKVSENAWRKGGAPSGGSTMFAALNSVIRLEDLIQGVIVQSANDGCIIIAEGMAGSEDKFADLMNARAKEIGLTHSQFRNSTGLPDPEQVTSVTDLVKLAGHLRREYPEYYHYYSQESFVWNKIFQRNRNPLLRMVPGATGMGTGYTEQSGYAVLGAVDQGDRRLILGLAGLSSDKERAEEAKRTIEWAANAFEDVPLFKDGEVIGEASVYGGTKSYVPLKSSEPVDVLIPKGNRHLLKARVVYTGPLIAPVASGQAVGMLHVWMDDMLVQQTQLFATEDIESAGLRKRATDAVIELATGWIRPLVN
ncbi:MAG: D-alanyl-D-alanine carboxypeptidase family protein [Phyllobacterium sp.]